VESARGALRALNLREDARAESLSPKEFAALADKLAAAGGD
jgi:16S rRNA A1518/A1519 N6-dimethyltransferase RsmA/KsgA/DIM1 with predicted DNA glycosylase/AP lyase activity